MGGRGGVCLLKRGVSSTKNSQCLIPTPATPTTQLKSKTPSLASPAGGRVLELKILMSESRYCGNPSFWLARLLFLKISQRG